jgi:hypothetical protein
MKTIKTRIHTYNFDTDTREGCEAYDKLCADRKRDGCPKIMVSFSVQGQGHWEPFKDFSGATIELETDFLFYNQWNTVAGTFGSANGWRVFDWAEDAFPNHRRENIKRGHWLEQTEEMKEIRRKTLKCGYCGAFHPHDSGKVFCDRCLDNEYLKSENLPLLRLLPVEISFGTKRAKLTEAEEAFLLPRYTAAQLKGKANRDAEAKDRARKKVQDEYEDDMRKAEEKKIEATEKRDALTWLLDRELGIDNVIFYSHTKRFSFGWRQPIDSQVEKQLLDHMSEFPFAYEIKCADGRTLQNKN